MFSFVMQMSFFIQFTVQCKAGDFVLTEPPVIKGFVSDVANIYFFSNENTVLSDADISNLVYNMYFNLTYTNTIYTESTAS